MRKHSLNIMISSIIFWSSSAFSFNDFYFIGDKSFNITSLIEEEQPNISEDDQVLTTQSLTKIISDPEGGKIHNLFLELNQNSHIINLIRELEDQSNKQVIKMTDLMENPVVLAQASGKDILILSCTNCSPDSGGNIKLKYLYNGMTMSYRDLNMKLLFSQETKRWQLFTGGNESQTIIQSLRLVPRVIFGQLIGIKRILVNS